MNHKQMKAKKKELEAQYEAAELMYIQKGEALSLLQDLKLYKVKGYKTFDSYVFKRFELTIRRAYQLIDAYKIAKACTDAGIQAPLNEYQCRVLNESGLSLDDRVKVQGLCLDSIQGTSKKITARMIEGQMHTFKVAQGFTSVPQDNNDNQRYKRWVDVNENIEHCTKQMEYLMAERNAAEERLSKAMDKIRRLKQDAGVCIKGCTEDCIECER